MYDIYTIQNGDTIESISGKFGTTPEKIYELNVNLEPAEQLESGKKIIVPVARPAIFEYYTIKKGDTLYNIAKQLDMDPTNLAEINGLENADYIYDNQVLLIPKKGTKVVITKSGDTLEKVSADLDANTLDLLFQNQNIYLLPNQLIAYQKTSKQN